VGHSQFAAESGPFQFSAVEMITSLSGFLQNGLKIGVYGGDRIRQRLEAFKLGVRPVASGPALEDFSGKQPLAPERDQSLGVKISRM